MNIAYFANIRLPTEKAHGLQIMQMCEAFAAQPGCTVQLYVPHRVNTPELAQVADVWAYYAVEHCFGIVWLPCIDLFGIVPDRLAFAIQTLTYLITLALCRLNPFRKYHANLIFSRDPLTLVLFSLWTRPSRLCYEAHQVSRSRIQAWCVRRVGLVIAITGILADRMRSKRARRVMVAHDGYRSARFARPPTQAEARLTLNLPAEAIIVGYIGRLHTMGHSKGVDTLIEALAEIARTDPGHPPLMLVIAGGPDAQAAALHQQWIDLGLPAEQCRLLGSFPPDQVPVVLAACNICAMPLPWTEHFAYYTSPLKLFEYMAAGRAIIASDLPSVAEVVQDGRSALLFPPGNVPALAAALIKLRDDPPLRSRLAAQALIDVQAYRWEQRAANILTAIEGHSPTIASSL